MHYKRCMGVAQFQPARIGGTRSTSRNVRFGEI